MKKPSPKKIKKQEEGIAALDEPMPKEFIKKFKKLSKLPKLTKGKKK